MGIVSRLRKAWAAHKQKEEEEKRDMGYLFAAGALLSQVETPEVLQAMADTAKSEGDYDAFDRGVEDAVRDYAKLINVYRPAVRPVAVLDHEAR